MAAGTLNLGDLRIGITVDTTGLAIAQKKVASFGTKMTASINNMSQRMRTFGYLATTSLTLPIVMAGKASVKMAIDFEFSMQKIVGLVGVAQKAVNKWKEEVLEMSSALGRKPQELADALYFISSASFRGAEAMNILALSTQAAVSGLGETQIIAHLLTSVMKAYAGTGITAAQATDILVAAVREGKAEASGFASKLGAILPIAAELGVTFADVAGAMAAMTLTGSSTAQASVYLKGIFNTLNKAATKGEKALNSMGSSYEELRKILEVKGTIGLLERVRELSLENETIASKVFPNIRALTGYLDIAGKNFEYNKGIIDRTKNSVGSLGKAIASAGKTIKVQMDKNVARLNASMIKLGGTLAKIVIPAFSAIVNVIERKINRFDDASKAGRKFRLVLAGIGAGIGPLMLALSLLGYAISGIIGGVGKLVLGYKYLISTQILSTALTQASIVKMVLFKKGIKSATVAIKMMSAASKFTWVGIAAAALGALILIISKLTKRKKELSEIQKLEKKYEEEALIRQGKEIGQLRVLTYSLKAENVPRAVRLRLIKEFNEKYSTLLGYMITEETAVNDLSLAYIILNNQLISNIKLQRDKELALVSAEKIGIAEAMLEDLEAERLAIEANQEAYEEAAKGKSAAYRMYKMEHEGYSFIKQLEENKKAQKEQNQIIKEATPLYERYTVKVVDGLKKQKDGLDDVTVSMGILVALNGELLALKEKKMAAMTSVEIFALNDLIEAKQAEIDLYAISTKKAKTAHEKLLEFLKTERQLYENMTKLNISDKEEEKRKLFIIEYNYLEKVIQAKRRNKEDAALLEAELDGKAIDEVIRIKEYIQNELHKMAIDYYKSKKILADKDAQMTIMDDAALKRKLIDNELDLQQKLIDMQTARGEDMDYAQEKLDYDREQNSIAEIDRINKQRRALIEYKNTYKGVLDEINKAVLYGDITERDAIIKRRQAYVDFYDYLTKSALENAAFIENLSKRELRNFINHLDEEIANTEEGSKKRILIYLKEMAIIEGRADRMKDRMKSVTEVIARQVEQLEEGMYMALGEQIGNMMSGMEFSMQSILKLVGQFLISLGKAVIAAAVISEAFQAAVASNPAAAIALGITAIAIGKMIQNSLEAGPFTGATPMSDGALVYGSTYANIGEYPGARNDPEVVQRASKLLPMIQEAVGTRGRGGKLYTVLEGKTLKIILDEEDNTLGRN